MIVGDDCALPPPRGIAGRRGLAGTILVHKVLTLPSSLFSLYLHFKPSDGFLLILIVKDRWLEQQQLLVFP